MDSPIVHHLMVCRRANYDVTDLVAPYSLHHLVFRFEPPEGSGYPFIASELWVELIPVGYGGHGQGQGHGQGHGHEDEVAEWVFLEE
jgi:hypothetical protein